MPEERPTIQANGSPMAGYLAAPDGFPPGPAVVVVQEWWGLNEHIEDVCRRLASEGFAGLAPDLYRGRQAEEPDEARKLKMQTDRDQSLRDLRASIGWLLERGADGVGVMGFCMGGGLAMEVAHRDERLLASVVFYGMADVQGLTLHSPLIAHFGTADRFSPETLADLRRSLDAQPYAHAMYLYDGAPHAFFNDTRDSYREDAARLAWERTIGFLRNELGNVTA